MSKQFSLKEMVGQMLLVGFRGLTISDSDPLAEDLRLGRCVGVVLFDFDVELNSPLRNIESPNQVQTLITDLNRRAKRPLLIAIDQEGGKVARLKPSHGFPETVSPAYLGQLDDSELTRRHAETTAKLLSDLGFTLNFAPSVDLNINPDSPVIGLFERSFSADAHRVIHHSRIVIETLGHHGLLAALKHFPGHGSAGSDSHLGLTDVSTSWSEQELLPYRQLISEGLADVIMTAHIFNGRLDSEYPATLSERVISGLLRDELGYDGVVISDDMNMKAITNHYGLETAIELAIKAGVDILLFGNNMVFDPNIAARAQAIILDLIARGRITKERIETSFLRIQALQVRSLTL